MLITQIKPSSHQNKIKKLRTTKNQHHLSTYSAKIGLLINLNIKT